MICLLKLEIMIYYFSFTVAFLAPLSRGRNITLGSLVYLVIKYTFSRELNFSNLFDGWIKACLGVPMYKLRRENGKIAIGANVRHGFLYTCTCLYVISVFNC